jgi:outer membrane protein OmpA-like peptidoglycan-associated protein
MPLKPAPKIALVILAAGGAFYVLHYAASNGLLPSNIGKVLVPAKYALPDVKDAQIGNVTPAPYPGSDCASVPATLIRQESWEWNAQAGELLANGGNCTTRGSLMEKHGVNLQITRQDDAGKMGQDLIACANEIHGGATQCSTGANLVVIMGDGSAQFAAQINPQLLKLGPDYGLKVIGSVGYSRGEDAFMAPTNVKADPQSFKTTPMTTTDGATLPVQGLLVEGVLRDGDWNIALKWAGDNNIPNNPDEKTFDAGAINWVNASDYNVAAADYVAGKCEDRKEVSKGKLTGKAVHVCVNGVVTWTPGDVTAAEKRGGLVKVVSSKEYRSQMPAVLIGSAHFLNQNRAEVQNLLQASFEGADQVKAFDGALHKAAEISAKVYSDEGGNDPSGKPYQKGAYWYHFFKPVSEKDAQGVTVSLGGSAVNNLADNKILFGMDPGQNDNFRSSYNIFSSIDAQQYPDLFKANGPTPLPDVKTVEDRSFITGLILAQSNGDDQGAAADTVNYAQVGSGDVVSHRSYSITFGTGSATPTPEGERVLAELKDQVAITGLKVKIDGFTDNTGSASVNTELSEARALEVKNWLQQHARGSFPDNRFASVQGHGPDRPVGDNSTASGKAANRRVEISLLQ